jgi:peptidoglycan/LPS O-acetylase OafA/YrhL
LIGVILIGALIPTDFSAGVVPRIVPFGWFAFFALLLVLNDPFISKLARTPALVKVGSFSYSLYLIHEPFVHIAYALISRRQLSPAAQLLVYELIVMPLCVVLGYVFYLLVERPFVRRSRLVFKRLPSLAKTANVRGPSGGEATSD